MSGVGASLIQKGARIKTGNADAICVGANFGAKSADVRRASACDSKFMGRLSEILNPRAVI
ncbi:MAG TPA: hypothetical protein VHU19_12695 [Pyrinomonadaceae bacterium]|jgi:hypothetical protein|nr:hypothetical protein [Pyrinomonadaceae bacterium]